MNDSSVLKKSFSILVFLVIGCCVGLAQEPNRDTGGLKYATNYSPQEYDHQPQNWCIVQDRRGLIYAANQGGLLEFDGSSWRLVNGPNQVVRSLAIGDNGTIYVGGKDEIGLFTPDEMGALHYGSLVGYLEDDEKNFGNVWKTHAAKEGVYFWTSNYLFRWDSRQINSWQADNLFHATFHCGGKLFVHQRGRGLFQLVNDSLEAIPGEENFAAVKIYMIVPYDAQTLLIGTRAKGFFLYDGSTARPFPTGTDRYLQEKQLFFGIRLSGGEFALATRLGGLVIIDSAGDLIHIYNKDAGLLDNNVRHVFEDAQGSLWLALNNGIAKIEYASPFSFYDSRVGLDGLVLSVVRHGARGDFYAGTTSGLYGLDSSGKFRPVFGLSSICWDLASIENTLLAAATSGTFQLENGSKRAVIDMPSYVLQRSRRDRDRVWVGTARGVLALRLVNGHWTVQFQLEDVNQEIRTIAEDAAGNLWLGTLTKGVLRVDFSAGMNRPVVTRCDAADGLAPGEVHVYWASGHVIFATGKGIYRFDKEKSAFIPDASLGEEFAGGSRGVFRIVEDRNSNIWFHSKLRNFQALPGTNGTPVLKANFFLPFGQVNAIYPEPEGDTVWFACSNGLVGYAAAARESARFDYTALIREVTINGRRLLYDGDGFTYKSSRERTDDPSSIAYRDRNLRFEFAAPFFETESATQYQYLLQGYDKEWSAWSRETWKDYTNLDSGMYTFRVRARNVYGELSREAAFRFKVRPPWTRTWWAFLLYAAAAFLLMFSVVRWRSWRLEQDKRKLEQTVKERTGEIHAKNEQLQAQSEKLKEMDQIKSRFFANISHEFRTPLTLIMGPLEQMLDDARQRGVKKKLDLVLHNSRRLLTLINQLLDLSKLDSGKIKLQASRQEIVSFVKGILASFELLARQAELDLQLIAEEENIILYFDAERLEEVVCNLLINACKFTPGGGKVTVTLKKNPAKGEGFPEGALEISVADTGTGIPEQQLAHIFDRFYQAEPARHHGPGEPGEDRMRRGTGIGLALAKELVELHHGTIAVHSSQGRGTTFMIRLPLGKQHLGSGEIVETVPIAAKTTRSQERAALYSRREEEDGIDADDEKAAAGKDAGGKTQEREIILVVEDNGDVRRFIKESLEPLYRVEEAADGRQGIDKARQIIPDLIVSDIMMPGTDGIELCRTLKQDIKTSHVPIVLLTARASEQSIVQGLETGADDYITKPFNTRILLTRIKNLIDLRRQLQLKIKREMVLQPAEIEVSSMDQEFMNDLQAMIEKNLADPEFNVEDLGEKLYLSRASLYRKILALTGETPSQFLRSYRLKRSAQLLQANFGNVTEVAFAVGFSSSAYFTRCFKEEFHQLPSAFQGTQAADH